MTSLTSKQSILIKVLVQGKSTFHRQQSDGVNGFTWNKQHCSRLWLQGIHRMSIIQHICCRCLVQIWYLILLMFHSINYQRTILYGIKNMQFMYIMSLVSLHIYVCLLANGNKELHNCIMRLQQRERLVLVGKSQIKYFSTSIFLICMGWLWNSWLDWKKLGLKTDESYKLAR